MNLKFKQWILAGIVHHSDRPVSGNSRPVLLKDFSDLSYSCLLQEKQCLPPALDESTHHCNFLRYSSAVWSRSQFCFFGAKLGECVALWFALTPPPLKWLTEQKNPLEVCKRAARYNEFGYNVEWLNKRGVKTQTALISFLKGPVQFFSCSW